MFQQEGKGLPWPSISPNNKWSSVALLYAVFVVMQAVYLHIQILGVMQNVCT